MLGRIKFIGPFVELTGTADDSVRRNTALLAFWVSSIALMIATTVGQSLRFTQYGNSCRCTAHCLFPGREGLFWLCPLSAG
jgi:hypothetical protein